MATFTRAQSSACRNDDAELAAALADYLRAVHRAEGAASARRRAAHLGLFFAYLQRRGLSHLALPWWEYVAALGWVLSSDSTLRLNGRRSRHPWAAAARILDTLRDFHAALARAGRRPPAWELERAAAIFRGGPPLRRLASLGYTGAETWRLWRTIDGRLATVSLADRWLGLLWERSGRSWTATARRLRESSAAAATLPSSRALRTRVATGSSPEAPILAESPVRTVELEALCRWLGGPATPAAPRTSSQSALGGLGTAQLVDRLAGSPSAAMPRPEMAELRRRGPAAVGPLLPLLRPGQRGVTTPLWAIVLVGELRAPEASEPLAAWLGAGDDAVAEAAAEALGRIGRPALPAVLAATRGADDERAWAWAAVGLISGERAHRALWRGLDSDPQLALVIARALARHGRRDAVPTLHARMATAAPGVRRELEAAIFALVHRLAWCEPWEQDWRLRYRPLPALGGRFPWGWAGIAAVTHRRFETASASGPQAPPRSLAAILADPQLVPDLPICRDCGGAEWRPTGVLACRHTARSLASLQRAALSRLLAGGAADVWSALDGCDRRETRLPRRGRIQLRAMLALERATLYWLVTRGIEELAAGDCALARAAQELATLYGSPACGREQRDGGDVEERSISRRPQNYS